MKRLIPLLAALGIATSSHARTWTSTSGSEIEAEFVRLEAEKVILKKKDGSELPVELSLLSEADQAFVLKKKAGAKPKQAGKKLPRHVLFGQDREPTRPNYDDPWPEKAEKIGEIEIKAVKEDAENNEYIYHSPHFEFVSNVRLTLAIVKTFSKLFETTFEAMVHIPMSFDKARTPAPDHRYRILLFGDKISYIQNGGPPNFGGVYMSKTDIVMVPLSSLGVERTGSKFVLKHGVANQILSHELVHQLMDGTYFKPGSRGWFTEGIAEYVSSSPYTYGRFTFRNNITTIRNSITKYDRRTQTGSRLGKKIKVPPLKDFMLQSYASFTANGHMNFNYAMGMAYTTFFIHMDDNGSRKNLNAFLKAMRKGKEGEELLKTLLAGRSWDELEAEIAAAWKKRGMEIIFP